MFSDFYTVESLASDSWVLDPRRQDMASWLTERMLISSGGRGSDWVGQRLRVKAQDQFHIE